MATHFADTLVVATGSFTETSSLTTATSTTLFVAPTDCTLIGLELTFSTAAGGNSTLTVTHETGTQAPGAGTTTMSGSFNLNATANTAQSATLSSTTSVLTLNKGDRLSALFANAIQSSAGITLTMLFTGAP